MGVIRRTQEIQVPDVSPKRMFKAMVIEPHTLLPKIKPDAIKSIDLLGGDGGAGTTRKTNFTDNSYVKHKIDFLDVDECTAKYCLIEGAWLGNKLKRVDYDVKFDGSGNGGCVVKLISAYDPKDGALFNEEDVKAGETQAEEFYTATGKYLHDNPGVCA
ncbi:hypothetical protein OROHE_016662 [Orobanche hederae]